MTFPRKTTAVLAFAVAFALAIALTTFLQMKLRGDAPTVSPMPPNETPRADSPVSFRVEQAVVDFATKRAYTTLILDAHDGEELPAKLWVWTEYIAPSGYDLLPVGAPTVAWGGHRRSWMSEPMEVSVGDKRRLQIATACPWCNGLHELKPTFYARVHLDTAPPERASLKATIGKFDFANATPVIVQGRDRNIR